MKFLIKFRVSLGGARQLFEYLLSFMDVAFLEGVQQFEFELQRGLGVSCVMFHIERELYQNNKSNWVTSIDHVS